MGGARAERRLIFTNRARQGGHPVPEDVKRPLWILLDRPAVLGHLAAADGRTDPQELLQVPLRHGRAAGVTVVLADQFDALETLTETVRTHARARVVLGPASREQITAVLGAEPNTTPPPEVPAGRGYARLGTGPVLRLQVPATPTRTTTPRAMPSGGRSSMCCRSGRAPPRNRPRCPKDRPTPPRMPLPMPVTTRTRRRFPSPWRRWPRSPAR
ncbi:FtsK domain-containing protein OS=Streptomyces microflavus OX=1919 GN=Smic_10320 PE=4 SV=1 [Streptomyces microflavus]